MLFEDHLQQRPANRQPLTPLDLLARSVEAYPDRRAVTWHSRDWSYRQFADMVVQFAAWLSSRNIAAGDVVSVMSTNRPEMLAAHYAVPMLGAVLNTINIRLDVETVRYILAHSESRMILSDPACRTTAEAAAREARVPFSMFADRIEAGQGSGDPVDILASGRRAELTAFATAITDEWQPICLNYTSGTTGHPKGVVYHHRGAYLNALGNVLSLGLTSRSVYLWTLPMFHCNGWCHTWAVTAAGGLHVCLDRPDPALIFQSIAEHGVTHLSCAPVVLYMMLDHAAHAARDPARRVTIATGGAAPTSALIERLDKLGFDLVHLYGLTESYGPATLRSLSEEEAALPASEKAVALAKQGVRHLTAGRVRVVDENGRDVPADGQAMGEIVLRGNTLMAGYHRDAEATEKAFRGGEFHTGDLAVRHSDGNIEIKDRSKDIIISGGENISSLELENVLHQHPAILLAAVVAIPDEKWGEVPYAFLELKQGMTATPEEIREFCRSRLAGFKTPKKFVFCELPKTATGKIQKFVLRADTHKSAADQERKG